MIEDRELTGSRLHQFLIEYETRIYNEAWDRCLDVIISQITDYYYGLDNPALIDFADYANIRRMIDKLRRTKK